MHLLMSMMSVLLPVIWGQRLSSVAVGDTRYWISSQSPYSARLNWHLAYQFCRTRAMELLAITNSEQALDLHHYLQTTGSVGEQFWSSGNKLGGSRRWQWMTTGQPYNSSFSYWTVGQQSSGVGECMSTEGGLQWRPRQCDEAMHFICQLTRCYIYNYNTQSDDNSQDSRTINGNNSDTNTLDNTSNNATVGHVDHNRNTDNKNSRSSHTSSTEDALQHFSGRTTSSNNSTESVSKLSATATVTRHPIDYSHGASNKTKFSSTRVNKVIYFPNERRNSTREKQQTFTNAAQNKDIVTIQTTSNLLNSIIPTENQAYNEIQSSGSAKNSRPILEISRILLPPPVHNNNKLDHFDEILNSIKIETETQQSVGKNTVTDERKIKFHKTEIIKDRKETDLTANISPNVEEGTRSTDNLTGNTAHFLINNKTNVTSETSVSTSTANNTEMSVNQTHIKEVIAVTENVTSSTPTSQQRPVLTTKSSLERKEAYSWALSPDSQ